MLTIRNLQSDDIEPIARAFAAIGWNKPAVQYERYLAEQTAGERDVPVALVDGTFAGYVTIVWASAYQPFREAGIPEIVDFNVLPHFRRQKIGTRLLDEAEARIARRSPLAGIGVGMTPDYGAAQRMYVLRGYVPDGCGLLAAGRVLHYGEQVTVDDSLAIMFTKPVRKE
jgi:GNAT superfamily N-acetyltransferase